LTEPTKLAVLLHADIVDSTSLVSIDEALAHERFQNAFRRFESRISDWNGIAHEIRGDALVAEFEKASDAANAAMSFQAENQVHVADFEDGIRPELRIGIALGEVVIADGTVTGKGIVLAQRLEQLAERGGVCVSAAILEAMPGQLASQCEDLGEHKLKGFEFAQHVFSLQPNTQEPLPPEPASDEVERKSGTQASIAVLPFDNMSADPEQEYFVEGMTDDITTGLSKFKELLVIARSTMFALKGKATDLSALGKQLNVGYILEGSVRRAGNRIRMAAQLVDVATGSHIWAERFEGTLEDIFELQDRLTEAVVSAVAPQIAKAESQRLRTAESGSYDAWSYVQLALSCSREMTEAGTAEAVQLLQEAVRADPKYAQAYAWMAILEIVRKRAFGVALGQAKDSYDWANKAVQLSPDDALCHTALGYALVFMEEPDRAIMALKTAVELNPNFTLAHERLGTAYLRNRQPDLAMEHADTVLRLSPYDFQSRGAYLVKGAALRALGRYEEAVEYMRMAAHMMPDAALAHVHYAVVCALAGKMDEGQTALGKALSTTPDLTIEGFRRTRGFSDDFADEVSEGLRLLGLPESSD
jgi:adenylate cyclase